MKLIVKLHNEIHELPIQPDYTLLAAIRRHRLNPPFSCTEGRCGKCKAKLISGMVNQDSGTGLGATDRTQGFILTCRSKPTSDVVEVEF